MDGLGFLFFGCRISVLLTYLCMTPHVIPLYYFRQGTLDDYSLLNLCPDVDCRLNTGFRKGQQSPPGIAYRQPYKTRILCLPVLTDGGPCVAGSLSRRCPIWSYGRSGLHVTINAFSPTFPACLPPAPVDGEHIGPQLVGDPNPEPYSLLETDISSLIFSPS